MRHIIRVPVRSFMSALANLMLAGCVAIAASLAMSAAFGISDAHANDAALIKALDADAFADKVAAIEALAKSGSPRAGAVLEALSGGTLYKRKADSLLVIATPNTSPLQIADAATGADLGTAPEGDLDAIAANNRIRRIIGDLMGALTLMNPDRKTRLAAADALFKSRNVSALPALDAAIAAEKDAAVLKAMKEARAALVLADESAATDARLQALEILRTRGGEESLSLATTAATSKDPAIANAAAAAASSIKTRLSLWSYLQNVWYGLSLGSVLLLAAIGLAITFGVMGVINMAHGEMVMLGAYSTYLVQEVIRTHAPGLIEVSLLIALPVAFLVTGLMGIAIERGIIRFLYGRPLETLLATFGVSLILQQTVRSIFGPTNREVSSPSWMSGAFELGGLSITYGRLWIIVFSLAVLAGLITLLRATSFGLQMRAVTQNRRMASSMGIRTDRIDAMAFALGSGIAGIAGVALSQIDNVSPNLGQSYIIDSFMVVVFGGVGNLIGTLVAAMTLGVGNKVLEPMAGAVLAKILILVFIILFIQKRPRGLFALKGRAIEA